MRVDKTNFWKNKRVTITNGEEFLGSFLVEKLLQKKADVFIPRLEDYDLSEIEDIKRMFKDYLPEIIILLTANVGGIEANMRNPGKLFYDNIMMGAQLMEEARLRDVGKFVTIGTICSYPKSTPAPFKEKDVWNGYPEEANAPYGLAKKILVVQSQAYRQQYEFNSINLLQANLYGPRDNFDLDSSHVIPALIKKCCDAVKNKEDRVIVWGTGLPTREFLYVEDAASGILLAAEKFDKSEPVNLGSGFEISIKDLLDLIIKYSGFKGEVIWDKSKPDGHPRRCLDVAKAEKEFGFRAQTDFEKGLKKTIDWYKTKT